MSPRDNQMGLTRMDDALQLRIGEQAVGDEVGRQVRPVAGFGGATEAIAADCTSRVGCGFDPGMRID